MHATAKDMSRTDVCVGYCQYLCTCNPMGDDVSCAELADVGYLNWKANIPILYDWFSHSHLVWPSLSMAWGGIRPYTADQSEPCASLFLKRVFYQARTIYCTSASRNYLLCADGALSGLVKTCDVVCVVEYRQPPLTSVL